MDQIYANAFLTIIAAAGEDDQTGLPGVSIQRQPQQEVNIQDTTILELRCWSGLEDLYSSKWASRAWTYQEGYLSPRRLIFTTSQVTFLCNRMCAPESVKRPVKNWVRDNSTSPFLHIIPKFDIGRRIFPAVQLLAQIEEYSKRDLTYESDSLKAFLGVLNYYHRNTAKAKLPVLHLFGGLTVERISEEDDLCVHLHWYHENPVKRRLEFPSWAWTGWSGPLVFNSRFGGAQVRTGHQETGGPDKHIIEISVQDGEYGAIKMVEFASNLLAATRQGRSQPLESCPKQLWISCSVLSACFQEVALSENEKRVPTKVRFEGADIHTSGDEVLRSNGEHVLLQICEGLYIGVKPYLDQRLEKKTRLKGILLAPAGRTYRYSRICRLACLLVRQVDDCLYERVGWIPEHIIYNLYSPKVFLDEMGNVMDHVTVPAEEDWFTISAARKKICLV